MQQMICTRISFLTAAFAFGFGAARLLCGTAGLLAAATFVPILILLRRTEKRRRIDYPRMSEMCYTVSGSSAAGYFYFQECAV